MIGQIVYRWIERGIDNGQCRSVQSGSGARRTSGIRSSAWTPDSDLTADIAGDPFRADCVL